MSAFEPNTARQGPLTVEDFMSSARLLALLPGGPAVGFALLGLRDWWLWRTWPTHVSLRRQSLGMDWWLHSAWVLWALAAVGAVSALVLLARTRHNARRSLERFERRTAEIIEASLEE